MHRLLRSSFRQPRVNRVLAPLSMQVPGMSTSCSSLMRVGRHTKKETAFTPFDEEEGTDEVTYDPPTVSETEPTEQSDGPDASEHDKITCSKKLANPTAIEHSIFVSRLSINTSADDVEHHFSDCGKIVWVHGLDFDRSLDDFYASCVVCFQSPEAAMAAVQKKHGSRLRTFKIDVSMLRADNRMASHGKGLKLQNAMKALEERKGPVLLSPVT